MSVHASTNWANGQYRKWKAHQKGFIFQTSLPFSLLFLQRPLLFYTTSLQLEPFVHIIWYHQRKSRHATAAVDAEIQFDSITRVACWLCRSFIFSGLITPHICSVLPHSFSSVFTWSAVWDYCCTTHLGVTSLWGCGRGRHANTHTHTRWRKWCQRVKFLIENSELLAAFIRPICNHTHRNPKQQFASCAGPNTPTG